MRPDSIGATSTGGVCFDSLGLADKALADYSIAMELESLNSTLFLQGVWGLGFGVWG